MILVALSLCILDKLYVTYVVSIYLMDTGQNKDMFIYKGSMR